MNDVTDAAKDAGVYVATCSPGDGVTRYKFFLEPNDYDAAGGLGRAWGKREALVWLAGYRAGRDGQ